MKELMIKSNKSLYLFFIDVFFIVLIYYVFYYIINSKMLGMITLIPFFIVVCSNRYTALGILMHDAAHFSFHNSKNINEFFGKICGYLTLTRFYEYRKGHLNHHQYLLSSKDPDANLIGILNELKIPIWKILIFSPIYYIKYDKEIGKLYGLKDKTFLCFLKIGWFHIILLIILFLLDWRLVIVQLSIIYTTLLLNIIRSFLEHWYLPRLAKSRSYFHKNVFLNITIYAHQVGYHELHHLLPGIPWYNLKKAHLILYGSYKNYFGDIEIIDNILFGKNNIAQRLKSNSLISEASYADKNCA